MQLGYSIDMSVARVGQIADTSYIKDVASYKNPDALVYIGRVVTKGTNADEIVHPSTEAGVSNPLLVRGVVLHSHECESKADGLDPNYAAKSVVPVMRKGRVWVNAIAAATESSSAVHVYFQGSKPLGGLRGSSDSTETAILPKSRWITTTTGANELAVVEVDL
jgi:hypothetical protein